MHVRRAIAAGGGACFRLADIHRRSSIGCCARGLLKSGPRGGLSSAATLAGLIAVTMIDAVEPPLLRHRIWVADTLHGRRQQCVIGTGSDGAARRPGLSSMWSNSTGKSLPLSLP